MKRITGRAVAKTYAVTMALCALAAFVVYSQQKADTNAISSSKVMIPAGVVVHSSSSGSVTRVAGNTNAPATNVSSGAVVPLTTVGVERIFMPTSKSGLLFDPSRTVMPGSKSAALFTPVAPQSTNSPAVRQKQSR